ncbi:MAG: nlpI [Verrucomicrobiales bacterium]|nr:nlpI [Verrucomicrobiales bacterium]
MNKNYFTAVTLGTALIQFAVIGAESSKPLIEQAKEAYSHRDPVKALELATAAIKEEPANATNFYVRAQILGLIGKKEEAVTNYSAALNRDVLFAGAYEARGIEQFKLGRVKESIEDFDRFIAVEPRQGPYQWMRGIALYEAKRFADGQKQFESHQTVNPNDVENAAWHFACVARKEGSEAARKKLLPIKGDSRVPLMTVYALYGGTATTDDVFKAAEEGSPSQDEIRPRLFYANFYVGLYLEAIRDERALVYLRKAAETYRMEGPMGDVALIHYKRIMAKGS